MGIEHLALFIVSGLLLNMAPGPDSLLMVSRSLSQGWKAGMTAASGIFCGTLVHITAAALGVSALLATSATAFTVVKLLGAAYLMYIGIKTLFSKSVQALKTSPLQNTPYQRIFWQGFWTNVLNPKVALFFLAFVPQFIAVDAENKAMAFVILGLIFNLNALVWSSILVGSASVAGQKLRVPSSVALWLNRTVALLFVGLGLKLALSER